jgi:hypothetical protein
MKTANESGCDQHHAGITRPGSLFPTALSLEYDCLCTTVDSRKKYNLRVRQKAKYSRYSPLF